MSSIQKSICSPAAASSTGNAVTDMRLQRWPARTRDIRIKHHQGVTVCDPRSTRASEPATGVTKDRPCIILAGREPRH